MSKSATPPTPASVAASFKKFKAAADNLNSVSDGFSHVVKKVETVFKESNLGVSTFVQFAGSIDYDSESFWCREIGYSRLRSKGWAIVIRTRSGDLGDPESERSESWVFDEAPRAYRPDAVEKLPELLDALAAEADRTAARIAEKMAFVQQFIATVKEAAAEPAADTNRSPVLQELDRQNAGRAPEVSQAKPPVKPVRG
jgi:hypothetical protein